MIARLRQDVKEPNALFKRIDSRKWFELPITNSNSTHPIPLHFSNEHQRSNQPKQSDTSSLQQAANMGEVKTPRQWFLWSIALVYVCAFASIYVQIPGREVSVFLQMDVWRLWWILGAALMNACVYTWTWTVEECRRKQIRIPPLHSFARANRSLFCKIVSRGLTFHFGSANF